MGGVDGWAWNEVKALSLSWFGLAPVLRQSESAGNWPQGLLDAYSAMIPKVEGDSTLLGQRSLCVLLAVYRLWALVRLDHFLELFYSWVPDLLFIAGKGFPLLTRGIPPLLTSKRFSAKHGKETSISLWRTF